MVSSYYPPAPRRMTIAPMLLLLSLLAMGLPAEDAFSPAEVFERRIRPIFDSPDPSSCTECHLAGVDLKNYILPSHEKTFLSLRDQGLIDLEKPGDSKILRWIDMGKDPSKGASLVGASVREAEREAFEEWIRASALDPKLRLAPKLDPADLAKPRRPVEVIRHARKDRLLESFERLIWSQRFRCSGCHMPGGSENSKLVEEHGDKVSWIEEDAASTLRRLLKKKLIDAKEPDRSLLLLKPLNEVKHGGGQKMLRGDLGYKAFRTWLEDYAKTVADGYAGAADLPAKADGPRLFGTEIWLKLAETPPEWGDSLLQVTLHAWDAARGDWEEKPIAISDRGTWGKGKLWQHSLILLAAPDSERARAWSAGKPTLPRGRYRIEVHVDSRDRLKDDWKSPLGPGEYAGEAVIESSWPSGYGKMTVVDASRVQKT